MTKIKVNINEIKNTIKEEILKEMSDNDNDYMLWNDYDTMEGNISDIPDIEEDEDYNEMLARYIDKVYIIKNDLEQLISDLSYFNDQRKDNKDNKTKFLEKNFVKEISKLKEVLQTITHLYDGDIYV